jgi:heme-degrading monooxygenase HmoA
MNLKPLYVLVLSFANGYAGANELIERAKAQWQAARAQKTEQGYLDAEQTLDEAVKRAASDAFAWLYRGSVKMERAAWLAQQSRFGPANEVMAAACADLDRSVAIAPDNYQVRLTRGLLYGRFPSFFNKGPLAKQDLEVAMRLPQFSKEAPERQAAVRQTFSMLDAASNPSRPDRFPKISAETSPVIAAASITMPDRGAETTTYLDDLVRRIKTQQGLVGTHLLRSVDHPGMLVIMTWWKDKQALNDWFYGDMHQGLIRQLYVEHKTTGGEGPSQVAIELLAPLPGGMRFSGGLAPESK